MTIDSNSCLTGMHCRSSENLDREGQSAVLASTLWRFPLIYLVMFAVRFIFLAGFSPLFRLFRAKLSLMEVPLSCTLNPDP